MTRGQKSRTEEDRRSKGEGPGGHEARKRYHARLQPPGPGYLIDFKYSSASLFMLLIGSARDRQTVLSDSFLQVVSISEMLAPVNSTTFSRSAFASFAFPA